MFEEIDHELINELIRLKERQDLCVEDFKEEDVMKLFLCRKCQDIVRCQKKERKCKCGESTGYYLKDGRDAVFSGDNCLPLAIDNNALIKAIRMADIENKHQKEPTTCKGVDFKAFVLLDCVTTIQKKLK